MQRIVILGGGTAGWMAAAGLARTLGTEGRSITVVESEEIGTIGVGEATIPLIETFHQILGISALDVLRNCEATFKLGIEFVDWGRRGERYLHPFGPIGADLNGVGFLQHWLRHRAEGGAGAYIDYNLESRAAMAGRFGMTPLRQPGEQQLHFAFHFDAALYAAMLRRYSERLGVTRVEGMVQEVRRDGETGEVTALVLRDGPEIAGDFFLDCSGFRGLLIEQTLGAGYDDWSEWLPCNRAVAVQSGRLSQLSPFTRSTALDAGWQWRIPLQHRTGNGHVFCDAFLSEDEASATLLARLDGPATIEPRMLRFVTGRRRKSWDRNVVALGLAGGFVEPLESTSIYMVQSALAKLMAMFPRGERAHPATVARFNAMMATEWERVRDFIIAHYKVTERDDTPFWAHCRNMAVPDSLAERLTLFAEESLFIEQPHDLFKEPSWASVLIGQGMMPKRHHPVADAAPLEALDTQLGRMRKAVAARLAGLPDHAAYIDQCISKAAA
ncbi:tryptophan halogenase family protein [Sphingomonas xinjiangensis]|uniref:Tryptophan halogenase n=1 Tax=Sphingomonas xinjiangensis TaxID=643568 RepID=A0A840YRY5_9SPHN|nr:tryptophan halogenase family protein [Sphingomonas xinjiangensis]MBB5712435.1 tryptophan halogenase [Sphingomonas xinjiangensis]